MRIVNKFYITVVLLSFRSKLIVSDIDKIKSHELSTTAEETSESKKMKDIHIEVGLPEASVNENLQTVETNDCAESSHTIDQHAISSHHGNNSNHAHNPNHAENKEVHLEVPEMVCYRKFHPGNNNSFIFSSKEKRI